MGLGLGWGRRKHCIERARDPFHNSKLWLTAPLGSPAENVFSNLKSTRPQRIPNYTSTMAQTTFIAVPGQLLGPTSEYLPGPGIHVHDSNLYASILGPISKTTPPKPTGPQKRLTKITPAAPVALPTLSIERNISASAGEGGKGKAEILPEVNSTVLCRVTRIAPRQATVAILVVGETVLDGEWQGVIRVQDVRATEKDKVKIFESFRPGDIVRAVVVRRLV